MEYLYCVAGRPDIFYGAMIPKPKREDVAKLHKMFGSDFERVAVAREDFSMKNWCKDAIEAYSKVWFLEFLPRVEKEWKTHRTEVRNSHTSRPSSELPL